MQIITFKAEGHDDFIDFLKGVCILWVVLDHALPLAFKDAMLFCLWGDMAVPIFLLIQCVHSYKKSVEKRRTDWCKVWKRIIKPFLIVQVLVLSVGCFTTYIHGKDIWEYFFEFISHGGNGRGSYYPKMYLEFALLIPVMGVVFQRSRWLGGTFIDSLFGSGILF